MALDLELDEDFLVSGLCGEEYLLGPRVFSTCELKPIGLFENIGHIQGIRRRRNDFECRDLIVGSDHQLGTPAKIRGSWRTDIQLSGVIIVAPDAQA